MGRQGKCSVPMWVNGCPAGFCDKPAFGRYIDGPRFPNGNRVDGKYAGFVPGDACPSHGGPPCPGIEIKPGVYSGCKGLSDCPICKGSNL